VSCEIIGDEGDMIMTEVDTAKKYLRKLDALMLDLTIEVDIDNLPEKVGKVIMIISTKINEALKILEEED
jgi:hypothetical protein